MVNENWVTKMQQWAAFMYVSRGFTVEHTKFEEIAVQWLVNIRLRIKEPSYVKYHYLLQKHLLPGLGSVEMAELTTERVEAFAGMLLEQGRCDGSGGLAEKTVRDILGVLKDICLYAGCRNILVPCRFEMIRIRQSNAQIQILTKQEQKKLEQFLLSDESLVKTGILMSLYMGLRLGEVCAQKKCHILRREKLLQVRLTMQRLQNLDASVDENKTKILVAEPKSASSIRDIPIPAFLLKRLETLKNAPDDAYILTGSAEKFIEPRTLENIFRRYLKECGIEPVKYHALRHTFATRCIEKGFDIKSLSEILGHANVNITLNLYVHSSMEQKRKNMNKLVL